MHVGLFLCLFTPIGLAFAIVVGSILDVLGNDVCSTKCSVEDEKDPVSHVSSPVSLVIQHWIIHIYYYWYRESLWPTLPIIYREMITTGNGAILDTP